MYITITKDIDLLDYMDEIEEELGINPEKATAIKEYIHEMFNEIYLRNNPNAKTYKEVYEDLERIMR